MMRFDQQIRLPTLGGQTAQSEGAAWTEIARMERAHVGPIWRLTWGHPEHGEPLASCSEDRTIQVWYCDRGAVPAIGSNESKVLEGGGLCDNYPPPVPWARKAQLQFDGPVVDVRS